MRENNLATTIAVRPLIQPHTCKVVSSIFAAMSQLKLASMTRAFLPSMPSTEINNGEKCFFSRGSDCISYPSSFSTTNPVLFPLAQTYRYPRHSRRFWRKLWCLSVCPISPRWLHMLVIIPNPSNGTPLELGLSNQPHANPIKLSIKDTTKSYAEALKGSTRPLLSWTTANHDHGKLE